MMAHLLTPHEVGISVIRKLLGKTENTKLF
jgi:hypothetical protein